jgi:hypothetical protein
MKSGDRCTGQRLMALGRAHDLVRPSPDKRKNEARLGDLLSVLLAPYDKMGDFDGRVRVANGPARRANLPVLLQPELAVSRNSGFGVNTEESGRRWVAPWPPLGYRGMGK